MKNKKPIAISVSNEAEFKALIRHFEINNAVFIDQYSKEYNFPVSLVYDLNCVQNVTINSNYIIYPFQTAADLLGIEVDEEAVRIPIETGYSAEVFCDKVEITHTGSLVVTLSPSELNAIHEAFVKKNKGQ